MNRRELISTISLGCCYLLFKQSLFSYHAGKMKIIAIGHRTSSYLNVFRKKRRDAICFIGEKYQLSDNCCKLFSDVIICEDEDLIDSTLNYCQRKRNRYGLVMEISRSNMESVHQMIEEVQRYYPDSLFLINIPPFSGFCTDDCLILTEMNNVLLINSNEYLKTLDGTMLFKDAIELLDRWVSSKMDDWFV